MLYIERGVVKKQVDDAPSGSFVNSELQAERRARQAAEAATQRAVRLQAVTSKLGEAQGAKDVISAVLEQTAAQYGETSGTVALLDASEERLVLVGSIGYDEGLMAEWQSFPVASPVPMSDVVRTGKTVTTPSVEALHAAYPSLAHQPARPQSFVSVPLLLKGKITGAMGLSFLESPVLSPEDIYFLESLGQQCAQALERIRLYEEERAARRAAEAARERLAFLAEASGLLSSSLDYTSTLARVARLAVPNLADWCGVEVVDVDGTTRSYTVEHVDPAKVALAYQLRRDYPPDPDAETGTVAVVRTGQPQIYPEITDDMLVGAARDERHLEMMRGLGMRSVLIVPLTARERTLGTLTMVSSTPTRMFDQEDLAFAMDLARRAATAVDNARLYEERSHVARVLQRSLLPASLPEIEGIEMAARYSPAAERHQLGGDFYDAFLDVERGWAVVVGDVQGKGANAAAVTGLIRHTLRATAMHETDPAGVTRILNDVLLQENVRRFCTIAYLRLELQNGEVKMTGTVAGHPVPYVLRSDGTLEEFPSTGMLVGLFEDYEATTTEMTLHPGDAVILYTDGVTDQRAPGAGLGEDGLEALLAGCSGSSADEIAAAVCNAAGGEGQAPFDDVAVLVFKFDPEV